MVHSVIEPQKERVATIAPMTSRYLNAAASLLYQSYYDDPLFMEIFQADKSDYDKRLRAAIKEEINVFWQAKEHVIGLFVGEQLLGVACVVSPDFGMSVGRFWHWRLKMLLTAGFMSTKQMIEKEEKLRAAMIYDRYHMMAFLAIHPNHQQSGLGNVLIKAVDELVEKDETSAGVGVYVTLEKYLDFFNSYDYEYVSQVSVGYVKGQLMFRKSA
ncbi:MAG: GNAT family N-acetyltransferase [Algicola sp.]|nr:GNAT family N-acetyltransferase [Algicola sp.]